MNDFLQDLFTAATKRDQSVLADYEDEDLNNFFERPKDDPKTTLMELAENIVANIENQSYISDYCKRIGFTGKSTEKVISYLKKNKSSLQLIQRTAMIDSQDRFKSFNWAVRNAFFSKKTEFSQQRKYAIVNFETNEGKLILNCSQSNVQSIKDKLQALDSQIRMLFERQPIE